MFQIVVDLLVSLMATASEADGAVHLSVVIPVYNGARTLGPLLTSLAGQRSPVSWEVVIADNGSTDDTLEVVEAHRARLPALTVVHATERGTAPARNAGARAARGRLLLFMDHDDVPAPDYVHHMAEALGSHELVCARMDGQELNPEWASRLRPLPQCTGPSDTFGFLPWGSGGTIGIRRELFEEIGGCDDIPYTDDIDLCWRAQLRGAELGFVPEAVMYYRHRSTPRQMFTQARAWGAAEHLLQRRYASLGAPDVLSPLRWDSWRPVLRHAARVRHRAGRAWLATRLGNLVGRLQTEIGLRRARTLS